MLDIEVPKIKAIFLSVHIKRQRLFNQNGLKKIYWMILLGVKLMMKIDIELEVDSIL